MTDWPEAVREYEDNIHVWRDIGGNYIQRVDRKYADAAIAALEKMVENARWAGKTWREQAEQAEAEVERLRWMLDEALHDEWLVECVWRGIFDEDEAVIAMKADLAARYEKERDGTA